MSGLLQEHQEPFWFIAGTSSAILRTQNSLDNASDYRRGFNLPYLENKFAGTAVFFQLLSYFIPYVLREPLTCPV